MMIVAATLEPSFPSPLSTVLPILQQVQDERVGAAAPTVIPRKRESRVRPLYRPFRRPITVLPA